MISRISSQNKYMRNTMRKLLTSHSESESLNITFVFLWVDNVQKHLPNVLLEKNMSEPLKYVVNYFKCYLLFLF